MSLLILFLAACTGSDTGAPKDDQEDNDSDGYTAEVDCDDAHASIHPDATEVCDGVDNNCDGVVDTDAADAGTWYTDADGDTYGDPATATTACEGPAGAVADGTDCDDAVAAVNPGGTEVCDALDNDCDGAMDDDDDDAEGLTTWHADTDADGHGDPDVATEACETPPGYVEAGDDCDDTRGDIHPGADEADCTDPVDYNCDGSVAYADADADGHPACEDCDDGDPASHPGAPEVCAGGDEDCDGLAGDDDPDTTDPTTWYRDADTDGYAAGTGAAVTQCEQPTGYAAEVGDCDDLDPTVNPGAPEVCDAWALDEDCDGLVNDADPSVDSATWSSWYADRDGDTYGDPARYAQQCDAPSGYVDNGDDCDDADEARNPGEAEVCDDADVDEDCDGAADDADTAAAGGASWYVDADGDGHGGGAPVTACDEPAGHVAEGGDCDDGNATVSPSGVEACDAGNLDEDCDGAADDADTAASGKTAWYADQDGDGYAGSTSTTACDPPTGHQASATDCDDAAPGVNPGAAERCDAADVDEDCDGAADDADSGVTGRTAWYVDSDADGYGGTSSVSACAAPAGYVATPGDCADTNAAVNPAAAEACDATNTDEDCDGLADDADTDATGTRTWNRDADGDSYGTATVSTTTCDQPTGYVADATDCDDASAAVSPADVEVCDSANVDEDCDGRADDADTSAAGKVTRYRDADGDAWGDAAATTESCDDVSGYVGNDDDCDDRDASIGDDRTWYLDGDGDGYGGTTVGHGCTAPTGYVAAGGDCADTNAAVSPGLPEACDAANTDEDCDGLADDADTGATGRTTWYRDADADAYGTSATTAVRCDQPTGYVAIGTDCNDANAAVSPGDPEVCDSADVDEDCDGLADNADTGATGTTTWYADTDADGYGTSLVSTAACDLPAGYAASTTDCDDGEASAHPGGTEVCDDGIDQDCTGGDEVCPPGGLLGEFEADDTYDTKIYGVSSGDELGYALTAGDFDGDGSGDLVAAARYGEGSSYTNYGAIYGYYGPFTAGAQDADDHDGWMTYNTSSSAAGYWGNVLANLGDIDADGADDVWVCCMGTSGAVYYGGDSGGTSWTYRYDLEELGFAAARGNSLATASGTDDWLTGYPTYSSSTGVVYLNSGASVSSFANLSGETANDLAGYAVAASDVDGDGYDDVWVGAYGDDDAGSAAGAVYLVYMPVSGSFALSGADAKVTGVVAGDSFGGFLYGAEDLDGDGHGDVIAVASGADYGSVNTRGGGYVLTDVTSGTVGAATAASAVVYGENSGDYAGTAGATGDVNGDGAPDFLIGADVNDHNGTSAGSAWLVYGPFAGTILAGTDTHASFRGPNTNDYFGQSVAIVPDTDGDGNDEIAIGSLDGDERGYVDYGAVWIWRGS